jgi:hypothetical protein
MPEAIFRQLRVGGRAIRMIRVAVPATLSLPSLETFDSTATGSLPAEWASVVTTPSVPHPPPSVLATAGTTSQPNALSLGAMTAGVVYNAALLAPPDIILTWTASLLCASATPLGTGVFARGSGLTGGLATLSGYAVGTNRHCSPISLVRYDSGVPTVLAGPLSLGPPTVPSGTNLGFTLYLGGSTIKLQVFAFAGPTVGQYLRGDGTWGAAQAWCFAVSDATYLGAGYYGAIRSGADFGPDTIDDLGVSAVSGPVTPPSVSLTGPSAGASLSGTATLSATASSASGIARVDFLVDGVARSSVLTAPYSAALDTNSLSNGSHTIAATAYDVAGNQATTPAIGVTVSNANTVTRPTINFLHPNINLEYDAYGGIAFNGTTDNAIIDHIDISNATDPTAVALIRARRPTDGSNGPPVHLTQYTNVDNVYYDSALDLTNFTDAAGVPRENVWYHTTAPYWFSAGSKSTAPVRQWWGCFSGPPGGTYTNQYNNSTGSSTANLPATVGQAYYVLYPERMCQVNFGSIATTPAGGWAAVPEYCTAVDIDGLATTWATLTLKSDATAGFTANGAVNFDPPAGWAACRVLNAGVGGGPTLVGKDKRYYCVRWRTTAGGTAPSYGVSFGRDFYYGGDNIYGTIPMFDTAADLNGDGYLNDAEYAARGNVATVTIADSQAPANAVVFNVAASITSQVGNAGVVTIVFANPGTPNAVASVSTNTGTRTITVNLATSGASAITTTYAQVRALVAADSGAMTLLSSVSGSGTTAVFALTVTTGKDARFAYESRMPNSYGAWRLNPKVGDTTFKAWASSWCNALVGGTEYNGVAMDNSGGQSNFPAGATVQEPTTAYADEYGACLQYVWNNLPPHPQMGQRWIQPNINGSTRASAASIVSRVPVYDCEAKLRPREDTWAQFELNMSDLAFYRSLASPPPLGMIDVFVNHTNLDWNATWSIYNMYAYYMMAAYPDTLVTIQGADPAVSWGLRFVAAELFDPGAPQGAYSQFDAGNDPANAALAYRVYKRTYAGAVVLFKPLSYNSGVGVGTPNDPATATTHALGGNYRQLNPDGTLGSVVTSVSLPNAYGAILIPA